MFGLALIFACFVHVIADHESYSDFRESSIICETSNVVLGRVKSKQPPWSLKKTSIDTSAPLCTNVDDLLQSLRLGSRNCTAEDDCKATFEPFKCRPRWHSESSICSVLHKFSHIWLVGDSLVRHMHQALMMLLYGNAEYGCLPTMLKSEVYDNCRCDGQFSESLLCRPLTGRAFGDNRAAGLCLGGPPFEMQYHERWDMAWKGINETGEHSSWHVDGDRRPMFLLVAGGLHYKVRIKAALQFLFLPAIKEATEYASRLNIPLSIALSGLGVHHRDNDVKYPIASREMALIFNDKLVSHFPEHAFFDHWNLTRNAATFDGVHLLTEANLIKAMYLIDYLDMISNAKHKQ
jgi:hypothetical protein